MPKASSISSIDALANSLPRVSVNTFFTLTDAEGKSAGESASESSDKSKHESVSEDAADYSADGADGATVSTEIPDRGQSASVGADPENNQSGLGSSVPDNDVYAGD